MFVFGANSQQPSTQQQDFVFPKMFTDHSLGLGINAVIPTAQQPQQSGRSDTPEKEDAAWTLCPCCFNMYSQNRKPYLLPNCGHSVCEGCCTTSDKCCVCNVNVKVVDHDSKKPTTKPSGLQDTGAASDSAKPVSSSSHGELTAEKSRPTFFFDGSAPVSFPRLFPQDLRQERPVVAGVRNLEKKRGAEAEDIKKSENMYRTPVSFHVEPLSFAPSATSSTPKDEDSTVKKPLFCFGTQKPMGEAMRWPEWKVNYALLESIEHYTKGITEKSASSVKCVACKEWEKVEKARVCTQCVHDDDNMKGTVDGENKRRSAEEDHLLVILCPSCVLEVHPGHKVVKYLPEKARSMIGEASVDGVHNVDSMDAMCQHEIVKGQSLLDDWRKVMAACTSIDYQKFTAKAQALEYALTLQQEGSRICNASENSLPTLRMFTKELEVSLEKLKLLCEQYRTEDKKDGHGVTAKDTKGAVTVGEEKDIVTDEAAAPEKSNGAEE